jgi:hypothetical protein
MSWKQLTPSIHTFRSENLTITVVLRGEYDEAEISVQSPRVGTTLKRSFDAPTHWSASLRVESVERSLDTPSQRV